MITVYGQTGCLDGCFGPALFGFDQQFRLGAEFPCRSEVLLHIADPGRADQSKPPLWRGVRIMGMAHAHSALLYHARQRKVRPDADGLTYQNSLHGQNVVQDVLDGAAFSL